MIKIYTDGACSVNPGIGGWGAIIIFDSGEEKEISGSELETTNNRMEITAVIKSLELKELNIEDKVKIYSDSTYVINTITKNWKRNANNDLWDKLDNLLEKRISKTSHYNDSVSTHSIEIDIDNDLLNHPTYVEEQFHITTVKNNSTLDFKDIPLCLINK